MRSAQTVDQLAWSRVSSATSIGTASFGGSASVVASPRCSARIECSDATVQISHRRGDICIEQRLQASRRSGVRFVDRLRQSAEPTAAGLDLLFAFALDRNDLIELLSLVVVPVSNGVSAVGSAPRTGAAPPVKPLAAESRMLAI